MTEILGQPESIAIRSEIEARRSQLARLRELRNSFLHQGSLPPATPESLSSTREAIALAPAQIRDTFANRTFANVPAVLRIDRDASGDQFLFRSAVNAGGRLFTYFWRQRGHVPDADDGFARATI